MGLFAQTVTSRSSSKLNLFRPTACALEMGGQFQADFLAFREIDPETKNKRVKIDNETRI